MGQLQVFTSGRFQAVNPFTAVKLATYNSSLFPADSEWPLNTREFFTLTSGIEGLNLRCKTK